MARYGRVTFSISYVVDLDDAEMIDEAREMLADDVQDAIRYRDSWAAIEVSPDPTATEADIHDYLTERRDERRRNKTETLLIPAKTAERIQAAIDAPAAECGCLFQHEVPFVDGRRMAIHAAASTGAGGGWTCGILLSPSGAEIGCTTPRDSLAGEYCVEVNDDDGTHTYTVTVAAAIKPEELRTISAR